MVWIDTWGFVSLKHFSFSMDTTAPCPNRVNPNIDEHEHVADVRSLSVAIRNRLSSSSVRGL